MRHDSESILETAIQAIHAAEPDAMEILASTTRVADRLGIDSSRGVVAFDWSAPKPESAFSWRLTAFRWALAPALAVLLVTFFVYRAFWQIPPGVRAEVESIDGSAYRISDAGDLALTAGDKLSEGDHLRTSGGAHAVLRLSDGSTVEVNERSVLAVGARGRNMTVAVDNGAVIVQAAKRTSGHLYVKTPDCRVAVTGTVFSVNAGIKGSRVAVLEGTVHVTHSGIETLMHAGDQVSTNDNLSSEPVEQQIAWSHDLDKYLPLLAQLSTLQQRIDQIPSPQLRYTSDLLGRVPTNTLLYVSIPNFGDFLSQANNIFHDQLKQSPALQLWWDADSHHNTAQLDALVQRIHQVSEYLGDEIVIAGIQQQNSPGFAIVADLKKDGLGDLLKQQLPLANSPSPFVLLDESSLVAAPASSEPYALIRQHEVVFSNSIAVLKQINAQLNRGTSGFATSDFGKQISAAYNRGAGVILAADLHQIVSAHSNLAGSESGARNDLRSSGMEDVRYLIAEHRERNGQPENHVNLQFAGTRQGVPSWIAGPAPIGSLEFVTPNASIVVAMLSKDPSAIADDILKMSHSDGSSGDAKLPIDLRNDLAANLGGDFLFSLDGAVLPIPAWKAVIEVRNAGQLEKTLEQLTDIVRSRNTEANAHNIVIDSTQADNQIFYAIHDQTSGSIVAQYTFADGYMIMAPNRVLLVQALHAHDSGNSLAHSAAFKALLPTDENANYSAIAYQNIGPALTPLLSRVSGDTAQALSQLAADGRPTAVCAWGKETRIEAASNSHLFGFDLLALQALIHPGNKQTSTGVQD